jgi:hypothetical protein
MIATSQAARLTGHHGDQGAPNQAPGLPGWREDASPRPLLRDGRARDGRVAELGGGGPPGSTPGESPAVRSRGLVQRGLPLDLLPSRAHVMGIRAVTCQTFPRTDELGEVNDFTHGRVRGCPPLSSPERTYRGDAIAMPPARQLRVGPGTSTCRGGAWKVDWSDASGKPY